MSRFYAIKYSTETLSIYIFGFENVTDCRDLIIIIIMIIIKSLDPLRAKTTSIRKKEDEHIAVSAIKSSLVTL